MTTELDTSAQAGATLRAHLREVLACDGAAPLGERANLSRVGPYRGYGEFLAAVQSLALGGARLGVIGRSVQGAPLFSLEVGDARAAQASVVFAGIHAMEWIGVEAALALAARLCGTAPVGRRVVLAPLVNVDGFRRAEADLVAGRRRFVRANARGVDLNRNWPAYFQRRKWLAVVAPWLGTAGSASCSEPEVAAAAGLCDTLVRTATLDRALSLHSFGNKVLFPYGARWKAPTDVDVLRAHARALRSRLQHRYGVVQSARWVPGFFAPGMEIDHLHDAYGAVALLLECGRGGLRWRHPSSYFHPFRWFNPPEPEPVAQDVAQAALPFLLGEG